MMVRLGIAAAMLASLALVNVATANNIATATGEFAPSFRGGPNSTYFAWTSGSWDGNPDPGTDVINGAPPINPGSLPTPLLVQNTATDIVSSSNNIYTSAGAVDLTLTIPTAGTQGTGFTTIIAQGTTFSSAAFGAPFLSTFAYGAIEGIVPDFVYASNAQGETQWWAKWELPGNAASYSVPVVGNGISTPSLGELPVSITSMTVDSFWSPNGFATDGVVPEPASCVLLAMGAMALVGSRRRK